MTRPKNWEQPRHTVADLADALGRHPDTIRSHARDYGLGTQFGRMYLFSDADVEEMKAHTSRRGRLPGPQNPDRTKPEPKFPQLRDADWLKEQYATRPLADIAREIGCSHEAVRKSLNRTGVTTNQHKPGRKPTSQASAAQRPQADPASYA